MRDGRGPGTFPVPGPRPSAVRSRRRVTGLQAPTARKPAPVPSVNGMNHLPSRPRPGRRIPLRRALLAAPLAVGLAACSGGGNPLASSPHDAAAKVTYTAAKGGKADPAKPLEVSVKGGTQITDVTATDSTGRYVSGQLSADSKHWHSTTPLAAGSHYTVRVSTEDSGGRPGRKTLTFDTTAATSGFHVTFGPDAGTYGVGEPITATLSAPVKDRASRAIVESHLQVSANPSAAAGSWYWVDDKTLHYRPSTYWPAHATITARSTLSGVQITKGLYGAADKPLTIHTGDRIEALTDASTDQMTFKDDGKVVRTFPVTTGKPGFDTRNGIKVVLDKESFVQMRSETVGIAAGSSDSYDLPVYWATRVTWSGEYVHAAPWSVGSQGYANVSHGCTGMSTDDAHWFFDHVRVGDIVRVVNSHGPTMTPFDNGFGDWNLTWAQWQKGSALTGDGGASGGAGSTGGGTSGTGGNSDQDQTTPVDVPAGDPARLSPQTA
ncbi:Lipoprotein-anchoring transpeptidase ErfK/SrfK [Actinacidiphila guanduensis]|uniref:Lipoprotein-anchoring transpeptidase ErfK/SrfK n=2 Tax=Actinacidiphila guanduensis TaxID=310781 RepID=A0A1H0DHX3_9ACTN|nr:Lipoprotein-anchoring transpeptidase ErfK/SrfK [Actinacidiphila guanduensis]